ncbi:hypothetical protein [Microbacterium sp.]|uniref:hypothetical protein n=2 Tax=Microbacterium sp. TaxID=51671 RepID=UPI003F98F2FD
MMTEDDAMNQLPHGRQPHFDSTSLGYQGYAPHPGRLPAAQASAANVGLGTGVVIWAGIALLGGIGATAYFALGAAMTHSLDGVLGDDPNGAFNWIILLVAIIGQFVGLVVSVIVMLFGIGARTKRMRRGTTAMVLGIVASAIFLLVGLIQLPLVSLFLAAVSQPGAGASAG